MAVRRVRLRRGTTAENNAYTGVIGEVTVDTEKKTLHVHDGTAGGETLLRSDMSNNASIATDINFTNADRTIGGAMTDDGAQNPSPTVLTLGGAGSKVVIAGSLEVTGNTTQADSLLVESRVIQIADGAETDGANTHDVGIFFTRTANANKGLFFWDEAGDTFKLGLDGNNLAPTATDFDTDDVNYTPASLSIGSLNVNDGNITNVGDIALDTISADGNTIGMTLKQAGGATAFTIVDDNAAGTGVATFLTINATDGSDSVTIDSTSFVVNSTTISLDNSVVINNTGAAKDFTVKGDNQANLLHTDGTNDRVGINNAAPSVQLDVVGDTLITGTTTLDGAVVINESGADVDFRVEGNTDQNLLHVDASADAVGISTATPSKTLDVAGTFGVSSKSTLAGSLDLTTASTDGITFRSEIAENGVDGDATLLRVNIGGSDGAGDPNYKAVSWVAASDTFSFDGSAKILDGALVLGDGTNATTISVVDQSGGGNTLGEHLTISAGKGQGDQAGGSIIFQTQSVAGAALTTVLTLDKDNKATFTGNIDFSNGTILGSSVGNTHTMTLGGHSGSTVTTAGNLTVTSALTVQGTGATALDFTNENITIGGSVANVAKTITLGGGAVVATGGDLSVGGNIDFSNGTVLGSSVVNNQTLTLGGNVGSTVKTAGDLTVEGSDISLGTATTTNHATISLPNTTEAQAGRNLTISSGVGSAGDGTNDGSLILRSGATAVLTLDTAEKATFAGDIDFSNGTTLGSSVVNNQTLTLGGNVGSTTNVAGILQVTSNTIKSSGATAITLSSDDVTVEGDLSITGASSQKVNLGATDSAAPFEITMQPRADGGDNASDQAGANLTITAGRSVGTGAGGSLIFQTSATGGASNNVANTLNAVLTLDTDELATFSGNVKVDGNVIQSSGGDNTITLSGSDATILGDLTVSGNDLNFADDDVNIGAAVDTTGKVITIGGATDMITKSAGYLRVGGDIIQASDGANTISIDPANDVVTFLSNIKLGGNVIQSSGGDNAITLSADDATILGDLSITGASSQKVNLGASDDDTAFEIAMQPRISGGLNNLAGANLTITAGRSVGKANGGSIIFRTSESDTQGLDADNNVLNDLQTVLTLDTTKKATFAGNVLISGNLEVDGSTTQIDSTISTYADPMIHLNKDGLENSDLGVYMSVHANDNNHQNLAMYWDDAEGSFTFASTTADLGDGGGAVNLSAGANYRLEPVLAKGLTLDGSSLQVGDSTGVADAFEVASTGVLTSKNTASFTVRGETSLVVADTANGNGNVFVVDTTNGHVETQHIMPLADSTYDLGTNVLRFREGFFDTINVGTGVTNAGTNTFSNATPISITTAGTNGITFRSEIAGNGSDGNATLLRVNVGGAGPGYKKIHWVAATDDFSVESGLISEGDFTVGASKFVVTASSGNTTLTGDLDLTKASPTIGASVGATETLTLGGASSTTKTAGGLLVVGNIDFSTDANRTIGSSVTGAGNTITIGGAAATVTKSAGHLRVGSNVIQASDGGSTITLDNSDNVTVANNLTVSGGLITLSNGSTIDSETTAGILLLTEDVVAVSGNLKVTGNGIQTGGGNEAITFVDNNTTTTLTADTTITSGDLNVEGADVSLGTNADNTPTTISVLKRTGVDKAGNNLTISAGKSTGDQAGGSLIFQTSPTGAAGAGENAFNDVLTLNSAQLASFSDAIKIGGDSIQNSSGTEAIALSTDNTLTTISATSTKTLGDLTVEGGDVTLGTAGGANTTISVPTSAGAGHALTISSGIGSNAGVNDGSLILRSGSTAVLTLDTAELATFSGNIKVGTNVIQSSAGDNTITLSDDDATVLGGLTITGTGLNPNGSTNGQLVVGAVGAGAHLSANSPASGGAELNDQASGDFIISTGKSTGTGAGGSLLFKTSTSAVGSANTQNALQTVLTLDKDLLATFAGNVQVGGDITGDADEAKTIFATTTTEGNLITLGGGGTVKTASKLRVGGNVIENSDGETTITLDANQGVTISGLANGTSSLTLTNGDLEIVNGGITTDAINGKVQFNDPNLYVGIGNSLNNRDVGVVGAYGDSDNSEFLSGSVYKPSATVGGKGGDFYLFEGKNKTEQNSYAVADNELAGLQVGNVRSVGTQTNGLITTTAIDATLGDHHIVIVTGDNKTITLPDATTVTGRRYIIKDNNAAQDGTADHDTLIVSNGGGIDGSTAGNGIALRSRYAMVEVISNGTQWFIIAESGTVTRL